MSTQTQKIYDVLRAPMVTEKSTMGTQFGQYVFKVQKDATKADIKQAVEALYKVNVKAVNTLNVKGKVKRFKGRLGQRSGYKKAVVSLAEGQTLDVGTGV